METSELIQICQDYNRGVDFIFSGQNKKAGEYFHAVILNIEKYRLKEDALNIDALLILGKAYNNLGVSISNIGLERNDEDLYKTAIENYFKATEVFIEVEGNDLSECYISESNKRIADEKLVDFNAPFYPNHAPSAKHPIPNQEGNVHLK